MASSEFSRRRFLATTAAASLVVSTKAAMAQDPDLIGTPGATPEASLPAVPPEFETETN